MSFNVFCIDFIHLYVLGHILDGASEVLARGCNKLDAVDAV